MEGALLRLGLRSRKSSASPGRRAVRYHSLPTGYSDDERNGAQRDLLAAGRRSDRVGPHPYFFGTFSQSARNFLIPMSVSGCCASCWMTDSGMVATSAPIRAAVSTWIGLRTLATSTCV